MTTGKSESQKIDTRIGKLEFTHDFANGYPTDATVERLDDERDFQRACQTYLEKQVGGFYTANESFDVGCDTCSPVSELYDSPYAFTGTKLRAMVDTSEVAFEQLAAQHEARARFAMATQ